MESEKNATSKHQDIYTSISGLEARHKKELGNLTLTKQPYGTTKFFILGVKQYFRQLLAYLLDYGIWLMLSSFLVVVASIMLVKINGPLDKHADEFFEYLNFGLWWIALGVASSIGLGSGLHTFVLYLGPHIALFTIKAMQCGRVDLKIASYDTIRLKTGPSWLGKACSEFGPPMFSTTDSTSVPLSSILPQVQLEAILWGLGTALGELPPYFISRAASKSGKSVDTMEEIDTEKKEKKGFIATQLNVLKRWLISHARYMNFGTILVLASVPNPLFDLAGIMCGQFGIPFWKFFLATVIGKAIIKTHIQTIFIIAICNNQLLHWIENELIWVLSSIPGLPALVPNLIAKLYKVKDKYLATKPPVSSNIKVEKWSFSMASIWNGVVWLMLLNFFVQIVNSTAQGYLKKQQENELDDFKIKSNIVSNGDDLNNSSR